MKFLVSKFKRIFSIVLITSILTTALPVFSEEKEDINLKKVIQYVKSVITVPEEYREFNYGITDSNGVKVYNVEWYNTDRSQGGLNVNIDENMLITAYSQYKGYKASTKTRLPKYSIAQGKKVAVDFFTKLDPNVSKEFIYQENQSAYLQSDVFTYHFVRMYDDIPMYDNYVDISVNRQTKDVESFYLNYMNNSNFPDKSNVMNVDTAKINFKEALKLQLSYVSSYDGDKTKISLVYMPQLQGNSMIDAVTGKTLQTSYPYYGYGKDSMYMGSRNNNANILNSQNDMQYNISLTPQESKAVEKDAKLLDKNAVEKYVRGLSFLEITDDMKLDNIFLNKMWSSNSDFVWNLNFSSNPQKSVVTEVIKSDGTASAVPIVPDAIPVMPKYTSIAVNAQTLDIINFSISMDDIVANSQSNEAPVSKEKARQDVEEFMSKYAKNQFEQSQFQEQKDLNIPFEKMPVEDYQPYSFNYIRVVNGIKFPENNITIIYSPKSKKIINYYINWTNEKISSFNKLISVDDAYQKLLQNKKFELQYATIYPSTIGDEKIFMPYPTSSNSKPEIKLIYGFASGTPDRVDAQTGELLDFSNNVYKEIHMPEYADIANNYAKSQIKALAEFGIYYDEENFQPDEKMKQKDFAYLISKTIEPTTFYEQMSSSISEKKSYKILLDAGIILENEKKPDAELTREECIKFVIRALKYDKIAEMSNIFNYPFKDMDKLAPNMTGYITIAYGLKLINGYEDNTFRPTNTLTRAEAAVIIYNYLNI